MSTRLRSGLAVVAIGVALFATLGESNKTSTSTGNQAPNAGQTGGTSVSSGGGGGGGQPASSKAAPIPIGTEKEVAKGWKLKVNSANLDADAELAKSNQFNKPQPGEKFVLVNATVTNGGDKPDTPFTNMKISFLPPSGIAVSGMSSCLVSAPDKIDTMAQMQPGSVQTGNLCFSVKTADIANGLLLAEPQFTLDENKDQQFFALA